MKKSISKTIVLLISLSVCLFAFSCTSPAASSWGKDSPCTRITGETINHIATIGTEPINAGQKNFMKAKTGDYFSVSYKAEKGNCKVEISTDKETLYSGSDMVGVLGKEKQFTVKVEKSGTYGVLVDTENFLGSVTVEKKSK